MKALILEAPGENPSLVMREVPTPSPGPQDILLKVASCGLCYHDVAVMRGTLRRGIKNDLILGHEISGTVVETGNNVNAIHIGDNVVAALTTFCGKCDRCSSGNQYRCHYGQGFGHALDGGFAQYVTLPQSSVIALPEQISLEDASVLACPIGVAIRALEDVARVQPGESVLATGAGGGLGVHAIQVASALGARVLAVTSSPEKLELLEQLDCAEVVLAGELDFSEIVLALTEDRGVDVVIDTVGSALFRSSLASMAHFGRMVLLGEITGEKVPLNLPEILFRDATIIGSTGASPNHIKKAADMVAIGKIKPIISQRFELKDAVSAYQQMLSGKTFGRVVLVPPQ